MLAWILAELEVDMFPRGNAVLRSALLAGVFVPALFSVRGKDYPLVDPMACVRGEFDKSFVDPTACVTEHVALDHDGYIAPFAGLDGSKNPIQVGDEAHVQHSVRVGAPGWTFILGRE